MTRTSKLWLLFFLLALQVGDYFSTGRALAHGAVELNPFVGNLLAAKLFAAAVCALLVWRARRPALPVVLIVAYVGIVLNNLVCWR